ncbi:MAG: hypothetical protein HOY71_38660 [Nonomuraea sp.]|nr:hypothetical protein [Nonomuraea sp.]
MEEERRNLPFECRGCWHVWEEEYLVRHVDDGHGNESHQWLRAGVTIPPPSSGAVCPQCGSQQVTTFPDGYLGRHPELRPAKEPKVSDPTPLISPVRPRWAGL